ncbi:E3 ubiquitin-protein ligase DTX4 [Peromyscus maniculatus bairdii]|uniref:E3 ubiquitin-protein ligase DTX4 n=1 Tax=Peromyscus maniculatus bairdii TaxID=230844 RepID=UPI003FD3AE86
MHPSALALNGQCAAFDMHVRTLTSRGRRSSRALVLGARGRVFCILDGQLRKDAGEDERLQNWGTAGEGRLLPEITERSRREGELCPRGRYAPHGERAEGVTVQRDPRGRPRSPRRNWCEAGAASLGPRAPGWLCKAGRRVRRAGPLHEAAGPFGAAAAAAEPGGTRSEAGGPGVRVPVPARLRTPPWAAAEAARGGGARGGGRGPGPEAAAPEEAQEAGPGRRAAPRHGPGLAMLLASAVVVWEWLNEYGRWHPYSPAVSHHIEAVVRAGPRAGGQPAGALHHRPAVHEPVPPRHGNGTEPAWMNPTDEWIMKWCIYTKEFYSAVKKKRKEIK